MTSFAAGYLIGSGSAGDGASRTMTTMARRLGARLGGRSSPPVDDGVQARGEARAYAELYQNWQRQKAEIAILRADLARAYGL